MLGSSKHIFDILCTRQNQYQWKKNFFYSFILSIFVCLFILFSLLSHANKQMNENIQKNKYDNRTELFDNEWTLIIFIWICFVWHLGLVNDSMEYQTKNSDRTNNHFITWVVGMAKDLKIEYSAMILACTRILGWNWNIWWEEEILSGYILFDFIIYYPSKDMIGVLTYQCT